MVDEWFLLFKVILPVDILPILAVIFSVMLGAFLQGVVGLGLNLIAAPLLMLIEPGFVPGPIMAGALVLTILMVLRDRQGMDLRGVGWMIAGTIPGTALASLLLPLIPLRALALTLGGLVLLAVVLNLSGLKFPPKAWVLFLAGVLSGLGGTLASLGAPPVALVNQEKEGRALRATLSGYFTLSAIIAILGIVPAGRFGAREVELSLWMLPGVVGGFILSSLFATKLSRRASKAAVMGISALAAVILIVQQLGK